MHSAGVTERYTEYFYAAHAEAAFAAMVEVLKAGHLDGSSLDAASIVVADFSAGPGCVVDGLAAACAYVRCDPAPHVFPGDVEWASVRNDWIPSTKDLRGVFWAYLFDSIPSWEPALAALSVRCGVPSRYCSLTDDSFEDTPAVEWSFGSFVVNAL